MAKVFTITEGLENLGALKTGGQGSVYKGKRLGEIITAIKILPTPLYSESETDKNFISFRNEVEKLKKVNESPNPNVVSIVNSGITDSGNFPFIEMEYIEGPDLGELLKPPHDSLFTIKETIRVAEQLSNALSHCHKVDVKHGDIKSNNVKFNIKTGNYILLDFGLSVMSDEQRRTSLRHAGAIEFMAPEQNNAQMFFQTDVYSFGVIIYELLAGVVPFPLNDNAEITRNAVMVSHMETPPPDLMELRLKNLPESGSDDKKQHEMQVPAWLLNMVYKCLEKKPENRFINGMDLHEHVIKNSIIYASKTENSLEKVQQLQQENARLVRERDELKSQLEKFQTTPKISKEVDNYRSPFAEVARSERKASISKTWIIVALALAVAGIIGFILYNQNSTAPITTAKTDTTNQSSAPNNSNKNAAVTPTNFQNKDIITQLRSARQFLQSNNVNAALDIYQNLSKLEVPEAMYEYANLALQNTNDRISCAEAIALLNKARKKNFSAAKTALGLIYSFADDQATLQKYNYDRCTFSEDLSKGSKLLMEALLQGDSTASSLLDQLNIKNQNNIIQDTVKSQY
ncbi:MAG: hypothetical protein NVSMB45_03420 [Ginsengibacter sp.]